MCSVPVCALLFLFRWLPKQRRCQGPPQALLRAQLVRCAQTLHVYVCVGCGWVCSRLICLKFVTQALASL